MTTNFAKEKFRNTFFTNSIMYTLLFSFLDLYRIGVVFLKQENEK